MSYDFNEWDDTTEKLKRCLTATKNIKRGFLLIVVIAVLVLLLEVV